MEPGRLKSDPVRIIVQARANSARLPGKVLMPVKGVPLAVLAALRLARSGIETVLATSQTPSDDTLATEARSAGLTVFRGALNDVRGRFIAACADLPDNAIIVRATGDNVFPDADFAMLLVTALASGKEDLIGTHSPDDGLPYGLSLEAFRLGALRTAARGDSSESDREHVTQTLWHSGRSRVFNELRDEIRLARLRCTVDNLDDYHAVCRVFAEVADPVGVSWRDLVSILRRQVDAPTGQVPLRCVGDYCGAQLVLGTAQIGMDYGTVKLRVPPSEEEAIKIIHRAITAGVTHLDTARVYGDSERRIGLALQGEWSARAKVITKLDPLREIPDGAARSDVESAVCASIQRSCRELGVKSLHAVLLHRARHRHAWGGAAWGALRALRADGVIAHLGVSVADPTEALDAATNRDVLFIQLPFNLLDFRWEQAGVPAALAKRPDIIVHARSVLLQGVLAEPKAEAWPKLPNLDVEEVIGWLQQQPARFGRVSAIDLCLAYVRAKDWIHGLVVGVESLAQIDGLLALFSHPELTAEAVSEIEQTRPQVPVALLNPALWTS